MLIVTGGRALKFVVQISLLKVNFKLHVANKQGITSKSVPQSIRDDQKLFEPTIF